MIFFQGVLSCAESDIKGGKDVKSQSREGPSGKFQAPQPQRFQRPSQTDDQERGSFQQSQQQTPSEETTEAPNGSQTEPTVTEESLTEPSPAEQSTTEQSVTEQSTTESSGGQVQPSGSESQESGQKTSHSRKFDVSGSVLVAANFTGSVSRSKQ